MDNNQDSIKPLIQKVLGYLAIRIRSRQELVRYLESKTNNPEQIKSSLAYLESHHLIDDQEFALSWAESRLRKLKGDLYIRMDLRQKGIPDSIVQSTLQSIEPQSWAESIRACLDKYASKWAHLTGYQQKSKIYTLLRLRGFSSTHIDGFLKSRVE